ncbi:hypothetical protein D7X55_30675 [Corallococcus sp. AB049A]|uniref:cytochrome-c oxidase n=1 Tax=Corallococcus interemptor TaxID=2316720 RepID=A0A3A8QH61_9BACT|nr:MULTISPECIES: cytochrome c oxidase subunit 3 [Corallococcus]RKH43064.1 hypothetical protein D7Y23_30000 [Corallococcus sp. AB050B]RKH65615.1 hypothetical protein D7X96_23325 [Corallococcus interemptor]RKI53933.1 hypothetical protein D7X55_30675 [Corallococcus sp. AB049A]
MSPPRRTLDVSHLPTFAFGHRDPLWWGVTGLMAIESTAFVLMLASYFYIRGNYAHFPPTALPFYVKVVAAVITGVMLLSAVPIHYANRAALKGRLRGMRWGLALGSLLGFVVVALRIVEFLWIGFRWDTHAYGSIFWFIVGMHTVHTLSGSLEDLLLLGVLFKGPVEEKHLVDVHTNGRYWFFVVASWLPIYVILYLDPAVLAS